MVPVGQPRTLFLEVDIQNKIAKRVVKLYVKLPWKVTSVKLPRLINSISIKYMNDGLTGIRCL